MDPTQKQVIEALLIRNREQTDEDLELGRQVYSRAWAILKDLPDVYQTQILWGSDDDRAVLVKEKSIVYESEAGSCKLVLTNFHKNNLGKAIAVEVPDKDGYCDPIHPDYLFAVERSGELTSPLGLVIPEIADTLLELFETVPKVDSVKAA